MSGVTIAVAGATGAVGRRALRHLLDDDRVGRVITVGRRPPDVTHPKLESRLVDLVDEAAVTAALPEHIDGAVCGLGTTMKQAGSKAAFRTVDFDAVVAFARAARARGASRFALVSSLGASSSSSSFYLQTKGQAEDAVAALGFSAVHLLRPSILDDEGARASGRPGERLGLVVMNGLAAVIGRQHRYAPISVDVVGRAAARLALTGDGVQVHLSDELHRLGSSKG